MAEGREPLDEAGGIFRRSRAEFEDWCSLEAGDRDGWARVWGMDGVDLKLAHDLDVSPCIQRHGFWESWVTLGIARHVKSGDTVWNIGGNVGYFAALFALLAGHTGRVVAFEPQPALASCIAAARRDVRLRKIEVVQAAVGRYAREAAMHAQRTSAGNIHHGGVSLLRYPDAEVLVPRVEVLALDSLGATYGCPSLIFCDAEGAEEELFLGSSMLTMTRPVLCIEWCPERYLTPLVLADYLLACGYRAYRFDDDGNHLPFDLRASVGQGGFEQALLLPEGPAPRREVADSAETL